MYQIGAARMSCTLRFPADYKGFNVTSGPERRKYPPQVLAFAVRRRWRHPEPAWAVPRRFPNHSPCFLSSCRVGLGLVSCVPVMMVP